MTGRSGEQRRPPVSGWLRQRAQAERMRSAVLLRIARARPEVSTGARALKSRAWAGSCKFASRARACLVCRTGRGTPRAAGDARELHHLQWAHRANNASDKWASRVPHDKSVRRRCCCCCCCCCLWSRRLGGVIFKCASSPASATAGGSRAAAAARPVDFRRASRCRRCSRRQIVCKLARDMARSLSRPGRISRAKTSPRQTRGACL